VKTIMSSIAMPVKIAILDDFHNVALQMADWSTLLDRATITVFDGHIAEPDSLVQGRFRSTSSASYAKDTGSARDHRTLTTLETHCFDRQAQCFD